MNRWLLLGLSAAYAGVSAQAAIAATPIRSGPAPSMAAAQPLHQPQNFDASLAPPRHAMLRATTQQRLSKPELIAGGLNFQRLQPAPIIDDHYDETLNKPTFIWAGEDAGNGVNFGVYRQGEGAATYAKAYLREFAGRLDIGPAAIDQARLVFVHDDGNGPVIARYQQVVDGLEVVNRQLNVIMDQDMHLIAISGYFASTKGAATARAHTFSAPNTGPQAAMNAVFEDLRLPVSAYNLQRMPESKDGFAQFAQPKQTLQRAATVQLTAPVGAKQVLFPVNGSLVKAWLMTVQAGRPGTVNSLGYAYIASDNGSRILYRKNLVDHAAYTYRVFADPATKKPNDSPFGNDRMPYVGDFPGTFGAGQLVTVTATQGVGDPWLPIPVAGFPTYETIGNNVWAYLDVAGRDGRDNPADIVATTTAPNTFDYAFDFNVGPTEGTNAEAGIVSLFYIDNWLHDNWYDAGFTEATGNAQYVNYGRGGVAGDPIHAEAQDFSGRNNANMYTPPDGLSPRQQMYLWTGPIVSQTTQGSSTSGAAFEFDPALPAIFGPQEFDVTADVAIYNDGDPSGTGINGELDACQPTSQDLTGKIALIGDIYTCNFTVKVKNAQNAGAVGALVVYNGAPNADQAFKMGGSDASVTIPALGVSDDDANPVMADIASGATVTLHMGLDVAPDRDGSVDTQIVAHEFFHYVSNRLVGNATGLSNTQGGGMGEGWSDIAALLLTARADDLANNPDGYYTVGGYATDDFLYGVRSYPYVTGSPIHFADITSNPEAHFVGTVWATALWEAYVGLYKHYAAEDPTTAYVTAKTKMMNYIIEGLMATPNAPTMIEARDAILAVARATSMTDFDIFITAFAKHGMGFGAVAPPRTSDTLTGVKESYKTEAKAFVVKDASLDVNAAKVCDADYSLDPGEIGQLKITLMNTGSADMTGMTAKLSSDADMTFANGGIVTFEPGMMPMLGGTVSATVPVMVNSADGMGESMTINVSFPNMGDTADAVTEPHPMQFQFTSNQDFVPGEFTDDVEHRFASLYDWTRTLTGGGTGWTVDSQFSAALGLPADNHYWYAPDNDSPSNVALVTPPLEVGDEDFSVSFYHYYQFEAGGYDGGVVEITTDGGATWQDVTKAGGSFAFGYNGRIGPYNKAIEPGRAAFVNTGGTVADGAPETISFGTALAGKTVQLRFRVGSDPAAGELGWIVDDFTVNGATEPMFSVIVPEASFCVGQAPNAEAGSDGRVSAGETVTLDGLASSDPDGGSLTYQWRQTDGHPVDLSDPTSATPSFTAPNGGWLRFELTVTDMGGQSDSDRVRVRVRNHGHHGGRD